MPLINPAIINNNYNTLILDYGYTSQTITNSTVESTVYSFNIPANSFSAGGILRFSLNGIMSSVALPPTFTMKVKYGSNTINLLNGVALGGSLSSEAWDLSVLIFNDGTNKYFFSRIDCHNSSGVFGGTYNGSACHNNFVVADNVINNFSVTITFGALSVGTSITKKYALLEWLKTNG